MAEERRYRRVVPSDGLHLAVDACRGLQLADEIGAGALADVLVRIAGARDDGLVLIQDHPEPLSGSACCSSSAPMPATGKSMVR